MLPLYSAPKDPNPNTLHTIPPHQPAALWTQAPGEGPEQAPDTLAGVQRAADYSSICWILIQYFMSTDISSLAAPTPLIPRPASAENWVLERAVCRRPQRPNGHCSRAPRKKRKWPSQRPCGKAPLTGYRQALPRGKEEKKKQQLGTMSLYGVRVHPPWWIA